MRFCAARRAASAARVRSIRATASAGVSERSSSASARARVAAELSTGVCRRIPRKHAAEHRFAISCARGSRSVQVPPRAQYERGSSQGILDPDERLLRCHGASTPVRPIAGSCSGEAAGELVDGALLHLGVGDLTCQEAEKALGVDPRTITVGIEDVTAPSVKLGRRGDSAREVPASVRRRHDCRLTNRGAIPVISRLVHLK